MNIWHALFLGILQGITEFLPISSSGHLIMVESFFALPVKDLMNFDVAVHFGTLLAIFVYFRKDFGQLFKVFWRILVRRDSNLHDPDSKYKSMIFYLIIGTIPAVLVGATLSDTLEELFRNLFSTSIVLILVALYFVLAEQIKKKLISKKIGWIQALIIGIAQAFALIPGISRSGATISTGLIQGVDREEAARFSFLLGSVAITAATVLSFYKAFKGDAMLPAPDVLGIGILSSFLTGLAAVSFLMKFLKSHTLYVFAGYRIFLGILLLTLVF